jgi:tetratricopeptide (TPR) repeat protein
VFSWSYDNLSPAAARMFRLLGVHPGPDVSLPAAASLAGVPGERARAALTELAWAHLLTEHVPGRYMFHDLLRAYAAEQAHATGAGTDRHNAIERVLDHYLHTCASASIYVNSSADQLPLEPPSPGTTTTEFAGPGPAHAWFSTEMHVLSRVVPFAAAEHFDTHAWQLPWAMSPFLRRLGRWNDWKENQQIALAAAQRLGDLRGRALATRELGRAAARLAQHQEAREYNERALDLFRRLGDKAGQAKAHESLGYVCQSQGQIHEALDNARRALLLFREAGHRNGEAMALGNVGWCLMQSGELRAALEYYQQALALHRELGHRPAEAKAWDDLGYLHHQLGDHEQAVTCGKRALSIVRDNPDRLRQADALNHLGDAYHALAEEDSALRCWRQAMAVLDELRHDGAAEVRAKLARFTSGALCPVFTGHNTAFPYTSAALFYHHLVTTSLRAGTRRWPGRIA